MSANDPKRTFGMEAGEFTEPLTASGFALGCLGTPARLPSPGTQAQIGRRHRHRGLARLGGRWRAQALTRATSALSNNGSNIFSLSVSGTPTPSSATSITTFWLRLLAS